MHIAVIGGGAIGCFLAARLSQRGHRLTVVARGEHLDALQRDGLVLREWRRPPQIVRLTAVPRLTERPDIVLLTVKSQDVTPACQELLPIGMGVPVLAMQNGVQGDSLAGAVLGDASVFGVVVMCAATYIQPGEVSVEFPGWLIVGQADRESVGWRTQEIAALLNAAVPTYITRNIMAVRWSKLIANLNNGLCAATGLLLPEIMQRADCRELPLKVMREGFSVVRAAGLHLDHGLYGLTPRAIQQNPLVVLIAILQGILPVVLGNLPEPAAQGLLMTMARSPLNSLPIRGSTWQSIARHRPTEIKYLNGEIVRLGQRHSVPTPFNGRLVEAVHAVEKTHIYWQPADLWPTQGVPGDLHSSVGGAV